MHAGVFHSDSRALGNRPRGLAATKRACESGPSSTRKTWSPAPLTRFSSYFDANYRLPSFTSCTCSFLPSQWAEAHNYVFPFDRCSSYVWFASLFLRHRTRHVASLYLFLIPFLLVLLWFHCYDFDDPPYDHNDGFLDSLETSLLLYPPAPDLAISARCTPASVLTITPLVVKYIHPSSVHDSR